MDIPYHTIHIYLPIAISATVGLGLYSIQECFKIYSTVYFVRAEIICLLLLYDINGDLNCSALNNFTQLLITNQKH